MAPYTGRAAAEMGHGGRPVCAVVGLTGIALILGNWGVMRRLWEGNLPCLRSMLVWRPTLRQPANPARARPLAAGSVNGRRLEQGPSQVGSCRGLETMRQASASHAPVPGAAGAVLGGPRAGGVRVAHCQPRGARSTCAWARAA
jgi:hypothetical protein